MLSGIVIGIVLTYLVVGVLITMWVEGCARNDKNDRLLGFFNEHPISTRINLVLSWPSWFIGGIRKVLKVCRDRRELDNGEEQ